MSGVLGSSRLREIRQVFKAELIRHLRVAPFSLLLATLIFPFLTIVSIYHLPRVEISGRIHFQRAVYSGIDVGGSGGEYASTGPVPGSPGAGRVLEGFLADLRHQPYYSLEAVPDARAAFERGAADLALELTPREGSDGRLAVDVALWRRNDFFSELFKDHLEKVRQRYAEQGVQDVPDVLVPADAPEVTKARESRSGLVQIGPFLLLGFAWFFLTAGTVEAFVSERERRTLELLLSAPVERLSLAWGKILFVVAQATGPLLAGSAALIVLGFSPWVLSLALLIVVGLVPATVACFWYFRESDSAVAAGWRTGLIFMLGFPLLILGDDVIGTLSPFYYLGKVLEGPPPARFFLWTLSGTTVLALLAGLWLPRLVRRWTP